MGVYHDKTVMSMISKHTVSYNQLYLATSEFPRIKLKIRDYLQYCNSIQHLIYIRKLANSSSPKIFLLSHILKFYHVLSDTAQHITADKKFTACVQSGKNVSAIKETGATPQ